MCECIFTTEEINHQFKPKHFPLLKQNFYKTCNIYSEVYLISFCIPLPFIKVKKIKVEFNYFYGFYECTILYAKDVIIDSK